MCNRLNHWHVCLEMIRATHDDITDKLTIITYAAISRELRVILLRVVLLDGISLESKLVQVMAWHRQAKSY